MAQPETPSPTPNTKPPSMPAGAPQPGYVAEELQRRVRISKTMERVKHKILVASGKGGVGKSTVATNLAADLSRRGYRVGILDMDLTGPDVPFLLGLHGKTLPKGSEPGLIQPVVHEPTGIKVISIDFVLPDKDTPVVWRGPMKTHALTQFLGDVEWGELDFLLIDLPPGTSDEPLSVAQNVRDADGILVVTTPQGVATLDVRKAIGFSRMIKLPCLGVVENMSGFTCPHCGEAYNVFGQSGGGRTLAEEATVPFLGAVPLDIELVGRGDNGTPFVLDMPDAPATQAFQGIVDTLLKNLSEPAEAPSAAAEA